MLINKIFASDCDVCSSPGPHFGGAAAIARGATGRWCEVLWLCAKCIQGEEILSPEVAAKRIYSRGNGDWPDFEFDFENKHLDGLESLFTSHHTIHSPSREDDLSLFYSPEYQS